MPSKKNKQKKAHNDPPHPPTSSAPQPQPIPIPTSIPIQPSTSSTSTDFTSTSIVSPPTITKTTTAAAKQNTAFNDNVSPAALAFYNSQKGQNSNSKNSSPAVQPTTASGTPSSDASNKDTPNSSAKKKSKSLWSSLKSKIGKSPLTSPVAGGASASKSTTKSIPSALIASTPPLNATTKPRVKTPIQNLAFDMEVEADEKNKSDRKKRHEHERKGSEDTDKESIEKEMKMQRDYQKIGLEMDNDDLTFVPSITSINSTASSATTNWNEGSKVTEKTSLLQKSTDQTEDSKNDLESGNYKASVSTSTITPKPQLLLTSLEKIGKSFEERTSVFWMILFGGMGLSGVGIVLLRRVLGGN